MKTLKPLFILLFIFGCEKTPLPPSHVDNPFRDHMLPAPSQELAKPSLKIKSESAKEHQAKIIESWQQQEAPNFARSYSVIDDAGVVFIVDWEDGEVFSSPDSSTHVDYREWSSYFVTGQGPDCFKSYRLINKEFKFLKNTCS